MKVVLLTNLPADPHRPRGGVQSTAVALLRAFSDYCDLDVHAVAINSTVTVDRDVPFLRTQLHYRRCMKLPTLLGVLTQQRKIMSQILAALRPDIIHACDTSYFKVRDADCPVVYHIQGEIARDSLFEGPLGRLASPVWARMESRALREADALIVNCAAIAQDVSHVRRAGVHICEEPVHADFFVVTREEVPGRILCVGQVSPLKNCLALVDAAAILRDAGIDFELRFAGGGAESYARQLRERIATLRLDARCRLLGSLSRDQLLGELATAAILAHPSLREHMPAAITEAMVVGVPVVASRVGGIPDLVQEGVSGFLVEPGDVSALAERLSRLLREADLRVRMGAQAKSTARERFHPQAAVARLTQCYRALLRTVPQTTPVVAVA